jgi:hypothetical protein
MLRAGGGKPETKMRVRWGRLPVSVAITFYYSVFFPATTAGCYSLTVLAPEARKKGF